MAEMTDRLQLFLSALKTEQCVEESLESIYLEFSKMHSLESSRQLKRLLEQAICAVYRVNCGVVILNMIGKLFARLYQSDKINYSTCASLIVKGMSCSVSNIRLHSHIIASSWIENVEAEPINSFSQGVLNSIVDSNESCSRICIDILTCLREKFNWIPTGITEATCCALSSKKSYKILTEILTLIRLSEQTKKILVYSIIKSSDLNARKIYLDIIGHRTNFCDFSSSDLQAILFFAVNDQYFWSNSSSIVHIFTEWFKAENLPYVLITFLKRLDIAKEETRNDLSQALGSWFSVQKLEVLKTLAIDLKTVALSEDSNISVTSNQLLLLHQTLSYLYKIDQDTSLQIVNLHFCLDLLNRIHSYLKNEDRKSNKIINPQTILYAELVMKLCSFCSSKDDRCHLSSELFDQYQSLSSHMFGWRNGKSIAHFIYENKIDLCKNDFIIDQYFELISSNEYMQNVHALCKFVAFLGPYLRISEQRLKAPHWHFLARLLKNHIDHSKYAELLELLICLSGYISRSEPREAHLHSVHIVDIAKMINSSFNEQVQLSMVHEFARFLIYEQNSSKHDIEQTHLNLFQTLLVKLRFGPMVVQKNMSIATYCMDLMEKRLLLNTNVLIVLIVLFVRTKAITQYRFHERAKYFFLLLINKLSKWLKNYSSDVIVGICECFLTRRIFIKLEEFDDIFRFAAEIYAKSLAKNTVKNVTSHIIIMLVRLVGKHEEAAQTEYAEKIVTSVKYLVEMIDRETNIAELVAAIKIEMNKHHSRFQLKSKMLFLLKELGKLIDTDMEIEESIGTNKLSYESTQFRDLSNFNNDRNIFLSPSNISVPSTSHESEGGDVIVIEELSIEQKIAILSTDNSSTSSIESTHIVMDEDY